MNAIDLHGQKSVWNSLRSALSEVKTKQVVVVGVFELFGMHEVQEFFAGSRIFAEDTQHRAGDGLALHLLDAPHHHAL